MKNSKNSSKNQTTSSRSRNSVKDSTSNNVKTQKSNAGQPQSEIRRDGPGGN